MRSCPILVMGLSLFTFGAPVAMLHGSVWVSTANAQARTEPGDAILGLWLTEEDKGIVEIYRETGDDGKSRYFGRIVWAKWDYYLEGDPEEGQPVHDRENPDPSLRDRPIVGLVILQNFVYNARKGRWELGTIYDPENGKTYRCTMRLVEDPGVEGGRRLDVRGYVGIRAIGRTTEWRPAGDAHGPEIAVGSE